MTRAGQGGCVMDILAAICSAARRTAVVATVLAAAVAAPGCASVGNLDAARVKDLECVDAQNAAFAEKNARSWIVVEGGEVAAISPAADDAVRAAAANRASSAPTPHRFVYRPADRGARLYRLAFLPEGGLVAGRQFLAGLGYRVASVGVAGPGRTLVLDRRGGRRSIDLAKRPLVRIDLTPLGGGPVTTIDVPLDPDFDGPLLLGADAAPSLDLDRAEIPGQAEVQVALGRPFNARRAFAAAKCPELDASGPVEVLVPTPQRTPGR